MPRYKTVVIDSIGEQARLYFSKAIKKHSGDSDTLRNISHYQPTTERLNIWIRRVEELKRTGVECVLVGHEQIDKIYAKGGEIGSKGQQPQDPIGVRGIPDLPGSTFPEELLRKCDCIFRARLVNGKVRWVAKEEPLGASISDAPWVAGARFHAEMIMGGYLPPDYNEITRMAIEAKINNFQPPYIWMIYGRVKIGKTRMVCQTFPKPMKLFDFDHGSNVLGSAEDIKSMGIDVVQYSVEEQDDYDKFVADFASCFK